MSNTASLTQEGMVNGLQRIINGFLSQGVWCHLYLDGFFTPVETTTLAQCLAAEAHYIGYAPQNLLTWSAPALTPAPGGLSHYALTQANAVFPVSDPAGSGQLRGFFLTDTAASSLYGVSQFNVAVPFSIPNGETFNLAVEYFMFSYYPYPVPGPV